MSHIVAPLCSPLAVAVVSCERLEASLQFYCDRLGFDAQPVVGWSGADFEFLWQLPPGSQARACMLSAGGSGVGRVLLLEFDAPHRESIQPVPGSDVFGLANLNFYVRDIHAVTVELRAAGFRFWSDPKQHSLAAAVGNPIEVIFDGPDGVAINLVQLTSTDPATRIGQMRAFVESHGYTRRGYTPVVTTSHVCRSIARARRFYEDVLHMGVLIDDELCAPHVNEFLGLPRDARTHITFMQGNHMLGKLALGEPLNYAARCTDLLPRAHAPNIGYLAQAFEVRDIAAAWSAAAASGADVVVGRMRALVPGLGARDQFVVRNPGSGALQWILAGALENS